MLQRFIAWWQWKWLAQLVAVLGALASVLILCVVYVLVACVLGTVWASLAIFPAKDKEAEPVVDSTGPAVIPFNKAV